MSSSWTSRQGHDDKQDNDDNRECYAVLENPLHWSSGLIDEQGAKARRAKIQKEADFYGAMDGATKFVKGDATLSLIITFVNLVGGMILGSLDGPAGR